MPTVLTIGSYRFYFYSNEFSEPPHIHIDKDECSAKFWPETVDLATNMGISKKDLNVLNKLVTKHQKLFLEKWYEFFKA